MCVCAISFVCVCVLSSEDPKTDRELLCVSEGTCCDSVCVLVCECESVCMEEWMGCVSVVCVSGVVCVREERMYERAGKKFKIFKKSFRLTIWRHSVVTIIRCIGVRAGAYYLNFWMAFGFNDSLLF